MQYIYLSIYVPSICVSMYLSINQSLFLIYYTKARKAALHYKRLEWIQSIHFAITAANTGSSPTGASAAATATSGFELLVLLSLRLLLLLLLEKIRGGADKSLARPTSRCRRTESAVPLERGVCSCAELQVFSCYRGWREACQATRAISISRRELLSSFFFPAR